MKTGVQATNIQKMKSNLARPLRLCGRTDESKRTKGKVNLFEFKPVFFAGLEGIGPPIEDLESPVIPLNYSPLAIKCNYTLKFEFT